MPLERFHPLVSRWFAERLGEPTAPQTSGWSEIERGRDTLIAAPTGSGKTLAAFLWSIDGLVRAAAEGTLTDQTHVVYVSPLKALGNDVQRNLQDPLAEIEALARDEDVQLQEIRVAVRSGDTPATERARMLRRPPHVLITTPESFFILLTAERSREFLQTAKVVIVDEIHAVAADKRGTHLALTLERLDRLAGRPVQRVGLSATQKPISEIGRLLVGNARQMPSIVDVGHRRDWDLRVEVPGQPLAHVATHEMRHEIVDRIAELSAEHRTTLVFVNTRKLVERISHELTQRLGEGKVAAHHGSLSREIRLTAERGLKSGEIPVVVATASLELGIDIGHVDLVVHFEAPRSFAQLLQRIGRAGHQVGGVSKGVLFPLTRDQLVQCAAAVRGARAGELDCVAIPRNALDILAQQIVAISASEEVGIEELWELVRRAMPYAGLDRKDFDQVLDMLAEGVATRLGRRSAHVHRDEVNGVIKGRRGARLAAITSGGAIPDVADYRVIAEPEGVFVGTVNEDFAIESMAGDVFLLGNMSWRIRRVESSSGVLRVEDAHGLPPTIPFWIAEAPGRTLELSTAVSDLRAGVAARLDDPRACIAWLVEECSVDEAAAEQIVQYVADTIRVLGVVPTQDNVVAERFFDEGGGMQLIVHAPFGQRVNRAWGLALRKRFCVSFDFELQAAATDEGVILSLGEQHSFPLESTFEFVKTPVIDEALTQSAVVSPLFGARWRWNAQRSLALLRFSGGRKVPVPIQRMRSDDLLSAVFPELTGCQEERSGAFELPDHPIINETMRNCLTEAMDSEGLKTVIGGIERDEIRTTAVETPEPSQMSHEILNSNPYSFLDNAPLEERRARAVALRRTDPDLARGVGALDPAAIDEVCAQAWPDVRDADELHDFLLSCLWLPEADAVEWSAFADELVARNRATVASWGEDTRALVAMERLGWVRAALPGVAFDNEVAVRDAGEVTREGAVRTAVHGWMQSIGPATVAALAERLGLAVSDVEIAMAGLEAEGIVLRGHFSEGVEELQWCERRLLARIHRMTVQVLREQIQSVSAADYMRFLLRWQHVHPGTQLHGRDGLAAVVGKLQGLELPAPAWEAHVLPARVRRYDPADLEYLCLSGTVAWGRLGAAGRDDPEPDADPRRRSGPTRNSPIAVLLRDDVAVLASSRENGGDVSGISPAATDVVRFLEQRGASFLNEIARGVGRLPTEVTDALWELVSAGLVTGDGVAGLRQLLNGGGREQRQRRRLRAVPGLEATRSRPLPVGRWALWRTDLEPVDAAERVETFARQLLKRYGVIFRDVLTRERHAPPWRVLLGAYRGMEARQEVRGGRFVSGFVGEQFALPESVDALRAVRKSGRREDLAELVIVSAADPLNLVGIIVPGGRISPLSGQAIAYRNGAVAEVGPLGTVRSRLRAAGEVLPAGPGGLRG